MGRTSTSLGPDRKLPVLETKDNWWPVFVIMLTSTTARCVWMWLWLWCYYIYLVEISMCGLTQTRVYSVSVWKETTIQSQYHVHVLYSHIYDDDNFLKDLISFFELYLTTQDSNFWDIWRILSENYVIIRFKGIYFFSSLNEWIGATKAGWLSSQWLYP